MEEQDLYWGYTAYRLGEVISSGKNPIPEEILSQATEIRWLEHNPEDILEPDAVTDPEMEE